MASNWTSCRARVRALLPQLEVLNHVKLHKNAYSRLVVRPAAIHQHSLEGRTAENSFSCLDGVGVTLFPVAIVQLLYPTLACLFVRGEAGGFDACWICWSVN